jgi:uncharacterized protein (UPF0335 family)
MATAPKITDDQEDLYRSAKSLVFSHHKSSVSWLHGQLRIGYNSAAKLIERMEEEGLLTAPNWLGQRTILPPFAKAVVADEFAAETRVIPYLSNGEIQVEIPVDLPTAHRAADDRLRLLIERVERLEEEKKGVADDIRDAWAEAKAVGYDVKAGKEIVRLRKMKPDDRAEREAILDTYKAALGLA